MQGRAAQSAQPRFGTLTKREREILKMLAEGKSVKEIAGSFELSVKTVEAHKFNLMRKLDIHNKAQLVQYAIQKKIIRLHESRSRSSVSPCRRVSIWTHRFEIAKSFSFIVL